MDLSPANIAVRLGRSRQIQLFGVGFLRLSEFLFRLRSRCICADRFDMSTGRKVFHCAVDETALTTNISEIKKWTTNGAITLVVPLYSEHFLC